MSFPRRLFLNLPVPGINFLTLISLAMVLSQVWLGSMADDKPGVSAQAAPYYLMLGLSWDGISQFRLWQFVSHALVHANWLHLMVNLFMLWFVGGRVIHILGQKKFVFIVVLGVLAGGFLHVLVDIFMMRAGYPVTPLVGVSGACLALLLTLTTLSPDSRMWPVPVSGRNLGMGLMLAELLLLLMTPVLHIPVFSRMGGLLVDHGGAAMFQISHACHLGGALVGYGLAYRLLAPRPSLADLQRARAQQEAKMD